MLAAVDGAVRSTVRPLPTHKDRKSPGSAAPSVLSQRLEAWLCSVEGTKWREDSEKLWSVTEHPSE